MTFPLQRSCLVFWGWDDIPPYPEAWSVAILSLPHVLRARPGAMVHHNEGMPRPKESWRDLVASSSQPLKGNKKLKNWTVSSFFFFVWKKNSKCNRILRDLWLLYLKSCLFKIARRNRPSANSCFKSEASLRAFQYMDSCQHKIIISYLNLG